MVILCCWVDNRNGKMSYSYSSQKISFADLGLTCRNSIKIV